jgi:hypothetical protein
MRADHFAPEAEAAIDRADMHQLQQRAIGVAMHDALHRRMRVIADRIGQFIRRNIKLTRIGRNCAAIGSFGLVGSISASIAGVIATA